MAAWCGTRGGSGQRNRDLLLAPTSSRPLADPPSELGGWRGDLHAEPPPGEMDGRRHGLATCWLGCQRQRGAQRLGRAGTGPAHGDETPCTAAPDYGVTLSHRAAVLLCSSGQAWLT